MNTSDSLAKSPIQAEDRDEPILGVQTNPSAQPLEVWIEGCSRCGESHGYIQFRKFNRPMHRQDDQLAFDWWGTCPTTLEPILVCVFDEDEDDIMIVKANGE